MKNRGCPEGRRRDGLGRSDFLPCHQAGKFVPVPAEFLAASLHDAATNLTNRAPVRLNMLVRFLRGFVILMSVA